MIVLENIKKDGKLVHADYYYPDKPSDKGHFIYNLEKDEYVEKVFNNVDSETEGIYGFGKTADAVKRLAAHDKFPSTYNYMWY